MTAGQGCRRCQYVLCVAQQGTLLGESWFCQRSAEFVARILSMSRFPSWVTYRSVSIELKHVLPISLVSLVVDLKTSRYCLKVRRHELVKSSLGQLELASSASPTQPHEVHNGDASGRMSPHCH